MAVEAYPNCRFYILIGDSPEGVFTEVSGLQMEMDVTDYQEGGNNNFVHRLPGFTKTNNLTLKRGIIRSNDLYKWCADISSGKIERKHVTVIMYDPAGREVLRWDFLNAYPVRWVGPEFQAANAVAAVETIELAHEGIMVGN